LYQQTTFKRSWRASAEPVSGVTRPTGGLFALLSLMVMLFNWLLFAVLYAIRARHHFPSGCFLFASTTESPAMVTKR
jgi:hypothetical protein